MIVEGDTSSSPAFAAIFFVYLLISFSQHIVNRKQPIFPSHFKNYPLMLPNRDSRFVSTLQLSEEKQGSYQERFLKTSELYRNLIKNATWNIFSHKKWKSEGKLLDFIMLISAWGTFHIAGDLQAQLCSLPSTASSAASPRLPRQHFPEPGGLYFSLVDLTLLLFCCHSHGLAPAKPVSVIIADSHFCHWHENPAFLPPFFLSVVAAFSLHYGSMCMHRA